MLHDDEDISNFAAMKNAKNILELLATTDIFHKITHPVKATPGELLLMILKFSSTNMLSLSAICNLISLINNIFEMPILPESRYLIDKLFNFQDKAQYHAICPTCCKYLGKIKDIGKEIHCDMCDTSITVSKISSSNCFVILDPSIKISNLIKHHQDYYNYIVNNRVNNSGEIKDIYDGQCYKMFLSSLVENDKKQYVTAIFNTDGAPRFESSQDSIWPIQLQINELPPQDRLKNMITCGMWFGKNKPNMTTFLNIFVEELNLINRNGIECVIHSEKRMLKLYMLVSCVDAVARAPMQGFVQFNGYYSCGWCLHPGKWVGGCVRFPILHYRPADRQVANTKRDGERAAASGIAIKGVKYVTPLINFPCFNIIDGFVPDYLHCYVSGVAKQITESIIKLLKKRDIEKLDTLLLQIKVPNQLSRLTRSLTDRHHWKAREWENWVLYYSIPLLRTVVNNTVLEHWSLLVESLHGLLKSSLSIAELDNIDESLYKFVLGVETIYGICAMTYNVHQLLHISNSVYNWGPLWAHSTFSFESGNNKLLRTIHSAKGINNQIIRYANLQCSISILENKIFSSISEATKTFCEDLVGVRIKKCIKNANITYFGSGNTIKHDIALRFNFSVYSAKQYDRIVKCGCLYTSCTLKNNRSNNSYAQLINGKYVKLISFILDLECNLACTIYNNINTVSYNDSKFLCKIISTDVDLHIVPTENIKKICVYINVDNNKYIAAVPNLLYY